MKFSTLINLRFQTQIIFNEIFEFNEFKISNLKQLT